MNRGADDHTTEDVEEKKVGKSVVERCISTPIHNHLSTSLSSPMPNHLSTCLTTHLLMSGGGVEMIRVRKRKEQRGNHTTQETKSNTTE